MRNRAGLCVILASVALSEAYGVAPGEPSNAVPELQALDHWIGTWDVDMTVKPNGESPKGMRAKGAATAEWILDGRFVQQTGSFESADGVRTMQIRTLMTYDPRKKVYRSWSFLSNGVVTQSEGTWDARSRTLTSTSRDPESGATTTTEATFTDNDTEQWSMVAKDREGKVVNETTGTNTRRKQ